MVSSEGVVKIGDLGLARLFSDPLQTLFSGDKFVVTIWHRAPELLLDARHYTPAIDLWAVGRILVELLALKPIFKGEEAKMDNKKMHPFHLINAKRLLMFWDLQLSKIGLLCLNILNILNFGP